MDKIKLGNKSFLYPMPVCILGSDIKGKANFMTISFIGIVNANPGMIALGCNRKHNTYKGIKENKTFSVNLPSVDMIEITDYVGIYAGDDIDKSSLFEIFYGKLENAPLIKECPLSIECKVLQILQLGGYDDVIIGEIIETYSEDKYLTNSIPDIDKIKPFTFSMYNNNYIRLGNKLGDAWSIGENYKQEKHFSHLTLNTKH
jgi:flavin reductase (DIM6/NTAB) family NADH-FMN oxidoreductase RutF